MHLPPQNPEVRTQLDEAHVVGQPSTAGSRFFDTRRKRWAIGAAVILLLAGFIWFLVDRARTGGPTSPPAGPPMVTVMVPGTTPVADQVVALGTIAARRDMPVGVAGEGGMISAIRVETGQYVRAGQVLAEIDSDVQRAQLQQLQASVQQAEADARLAQSELDRALALVERGFISRADIDRRTATRDSARARVAVTRAQVREMEQRIARLAIRAPEAGLVLERKVEPGQVVSPGSGALYRIAAGGLLELRARVAEQDMPQLQVGQIATVVPIGSATRYAGRVWLLEPVIDLNSRQGGARIALPSSRELRVGGFANVSIEGTRTMRPLIPQSALQTDGTGNYVMLVAPDNVVKRQPVTIGNVSDDGVIVTGGLSGREQVVVSAGAFLTPGEKVNPVRAPASRAQG